VVLALAVVQLLMAMTFTLDGFMLLSVGKVSGIAYLEAFIGCLVFYVGAVLFAVNSARGKYSFLAAATLFVLSLFGWPGLLTVALPYSFGAVAALLSFALAMAAKKA
jgi:hypothetical protein